MTDTPEISPEDWDQYTPAEEYLGPDEDPFAGIDSEKGNGTEKPPAGAEAPKRGRLTPIRFCDMKAVTKGRWVVKRLIPADGLTVVWGPPKSGKSFWTTDVLLHVALGWTYRDHKVKAGPVVYVAAEGGSGFGARLTAFRLHHDLPYDSDPPFYTIPARVELIADHVQLISEICVALGETKPVAVVLDTLNRTIGGSENDPADMGAYVAAADAVREALHCAVVIVHHCGVEGTRPRGHTSLTGAVDAQIAISRNAAKLIRTEVEWQKDGPGEGDTTTSRLEVIEVGVDEDGEPVTSCVVVKADDEARNQPARKVTGQAKTALELLTRAIIDEGKTTPASNHIPPGQIVVPLALWRTYCHSGLVTDRDNQDTKRRAFNRNAKKLQELGFIGTWDDLVWIAGQPGQGGTT